MEKKFYVYILCSKKQGTLYIGMTNNLKRRLFEHKNNLMPGFTSKYKINRLIYYEIYESVQAAISREKQIKKWHRMWKFKLIVQTNPDWNDLCEFL